MFHRQPLYNIVGSGTEGTREDAIRFMSRSITDPKTPGILAAEGVRTCWSTTTSIASRVRQPPVAAEAFRLIRTFPGVRVFGLEQDVQPVDLECVARAAAVKAFRTLAARAFESAMDANLANIEALLERGSDHSLLDVGCDDGERTLAFAGRSGRRSCPASRSCPSAPSKRRRAASPSCRPT